MTILNKINFFKDKTFLLVDDCQMILNATRSRLVKNGCANDNVYFAKDAKVAMSACITRTYDFIICDYNLGSGTDGLQLLEQMHNKSLIREHTVIFVVTGEMSKGVFYGFAEYEPDGYLIKPINISAITNRLITCYRQKNIIHNIKKTHRLNGVQAALALCDKYDEVTTISFLRAEIYLGEGRADLAQTIYIKLINNEVIEARIKLAYLLIEQKKFDLAMKLIAAIIDDKKFRFKALQIQALCYLHQGKVMSAVDTLKDISSLSPNNVGRLINQYNLSLHFSDVDASLSFANKINSKIKNSMWYSVDHCLISARCLLLKAEKESELQSRKQILSDFKKHLKLIEKKFRLSEYKWHRELIICRYLLLIGNVKSAEEIWLSYQAEEPITDFYSHLDELFIAYVLGEKNDVVALKFEHDELKLSQQLLIAHIKQSDAKKQSKIAKLKEVAIQSHNKNEPMKAINQWLKVWQAQPFELDTALALIKGFSLAIPMNISITQLKTIYLQAVETITSKVQGEQVPAWFNTTNDEVEAAFKALEQD
jgi:DNA-binding response OmpR family regulator